MTGPTLALAEALCRAQEAAQSLGEVAPTTAEHWEGVAVRAHAYLLKEGWRITSAPEPSDAAGSRGPAVDDTTADDPARAQGAPPPGMTKEEFTPYWQGRLDTAVTAALGPVLLLLLGLAAEMSDHDAPFNRQGWLAPLNEAIALIDARLGP